MTVASRGEACGNADLWVLGCRARCGLESLEGPGLGFKILTPRDCGLRVPKRALPSFGLESPAGLNCRQEVSYTPDFGLHARCPIECELELPEGPSLGLKMFIVEDLGLRALKRASNRAVTICMPSHVGPENVVRLPYSRRSRVGFGTNLMRVRQEYDEPAQIRRASDANAAPT